MIESDTDRLEMIQAVGGVCVKCNKGEFQAIFDYEFIEIEGDPPVEGRAPVLTARSSDVARLELRAGSLVEIDGDRFKVQRPEPDGTGITKLVLRK